MENLCSVRVAASASVAGPALSVKYRIAPIQKLGFGIIFIIESKPLDGASAPVHHPGSGMKLRDCSCGGIPQVIYRMDQNMEFTVSCPTCGNRTPAFENLVEAVKAWNTHCWEMGDCIEEQLAE